MGNESMPTVGAQTQYVFYSNPWEHERREGFI